MILRLPRLAFFKPLVLPLFSLLFLMPSAFAQQPAPKTDTASVPADASPLTPVSDDAKNNVTLDFKEADINTVLRVMSLKSGMNIVAGPEVQGNVTIRLENVHWQKALDVLLRTYGYVYERDENVIRVTTRDNLAQEPLVTKTFVLNYSKATEIQDAVKDMLTERGRIKIAERVNMLVVTDIPTNLYRIEEVVAKLDKITAQAYIDSKIVKTAMGETENLGIDWNLDARATGSSRPTTFPFSDSGQGENISPALRQFFPFVNTDPGTAVVNPGDNRSFPAPKITATGTYSYGTLDFSRFSSILQMLQSRTNTKVVSNPRIVVLNNNTAEIQVGVDFPIPKYERNENTGVLTVSGLDYRKIGVILGVTPHINSAEEILVELKPEVSSQGATIDYDDLQAVSFNITKAVTQVLIRSGETIAIGGLLTDAAGNAENKVPYLSEIPLVGKLFRSKRQTAGDSNSKAETLFFITVTMVDTEGQPTGKEAEKIRKKIGQDKAAQASEEDAAAQPVKKDETTQTPETDPAQSPASPESQDTQPAAA